MKIVLLSGGSGKRLWPLSNDSRSKQFLRILEDDGNRLCSMVQRVWKQLGSEGLQSSAYLATSRSQVEMIHSQLGSEVDIIVEPERRDTFPAIALSAVYLYSMKDVSLKETIAVLPVDPYVEDHFFARLRDLEQAVRDSGADLGLMGVKPTYPSEKYGYIVPVGREHGTDQSTEYVKVQRFAEKPCQEQAHQLIQEDALWNCGVFAFRLEYLINQLMERGLPIQYEELLKHYSRLKKISFDYEIVERAKNIIVLPYEGEWKDLGTWNTLTEEIEAPLIGKGIVTEDCTGTHVINELDIPITVMGIKGAIIAASPDGILVSDKEASPRIKDVMKHQEQRPMYEERRWGYYKVLDYVKYPDGQEMLTKRICIQEGRHLSYQMHFKRQEVWTVISGQGEMILEKEKRFIRAGDVIVIPKEAKHSVRALTELDMVEVQTGTELVEDDIVRLAMKWEEILQLCTS